MPSQRPTDHELRRFDLYAGQPGSDVRSTAELISQMLESPAELHESDEQGEYFMITGPDYRITVDPHVPDDEGLLDEPEFASTRVLIRVDGEPTVIGAIETYL